MEVSKKLKDSVTENMWLSIYKMKEYTRRLGLLDLQDDKVLDVYSEFVGFNNIMYAIDPGYIRNKRVLAGVDVLESYGVFDHVFIFADREDRIYLVSNPYAQEFKAAHMVYDYVMEKSQADEVRLYSKDKSIWNPGETYMLVLVYHL